MSDLYKSLRTIIFEVQAAAAPAPVAQPQQAAKPKTERKKGEVWKTASGHFGAKNPAGVTDYFGDEQRAKAYSKGQGRGGSVDHGEVDSSREVPLDQDGYAKDKAADQKPVAKGAVQPDAAKPAATGTGKPAPQAKAVPADTQHQAQPQGGKAGAEKAKPQEPQPEEEHPEIAAEDPKTQFDTGFTEDPTQKPKVDIRKANVVANAVKTKAFAGPQQDRDSVFGDAATERAFADEMNHAALAALRGQKVIDFELCAKVFSQVGFCYDKSGIKTTKGIVRKEMPQFSSQVDPSKTDSAAFKTLMAGKGYTSPDQVTPEDLKLEINMEKQYREALEQAGYEIQEEEVDATALKPIQGELLGSKVAAMYATLVAAQQDPDNYGKQASRLLEPIYVSDGYVIDGHHRWAAQCAVDIANGNGTNAKMKTRTITKGGKPVPVDEIIQFSNKFQKDIGLMSQSRSGATVQDKPKTQKESFIGAFKRCRIGRAVQNIHESVQSRLDEAAKKKFDRTPTIGTFRSGMVVDTDDPQYYAGALTPSKPRKTDAAGNLLKSKKDQEKISFGWKKTQAAVSANIATAQDLIDTADIKPVGTTFEIYGTKGGKASTIKVKKVMKMGDVVYMVGTTPVELYAAGTGLQILNKKTRRIMLDRGNDMIWESADFSDVGKISINEIRKLSKDELAKIDAERRKRVMAAKDAAINKRSEEGKAAWKKMK
jgi:hypothetical protein